MALTVTPRGVLATLLVVLVAAVCVRLGFWQLDRLAERREANASVAAALRLPPFALDASTLGAVAADPSRVEHRRVALRGEYLPDAEVVVRGRARDGRPGVNLVTPMRVEGSGHVVLVNRGWAPSADARSLDSGALREPGVQHVVGLVQPLSPDEAPNVVLREPGRAETSVQRVTRAAMEPRVGTAVLPFLVVQLPEPPRAEPPLRNEPPSQSEGNHLGYAIQWFSFAAIAVIGWAVLAFRGARLSAAAPPTRPVP
jgi:surfeit locus 1 family protein